VEAAALPIIGVSACQALAENAGLYRTKVITHGSSGKIGSVAIKIAKHLGVYIATTVSTNDRHIVQELGANQIIDNNTENFEVILHYYDAVYDTVDG
jgi:NADPH:quinone reductase-like Zn-dependent oxidoreductase